jgi:preprotein translocase subunit SecA
MERLGMEEGEVIEHTWLSRAIEGAQKRVEGHNFDIRKNLLEYDDVMNQQRKTIYALRRQVLEGRYAPELSAEEKKAGKLPSAVPVPEKSGDHTTASLTKAVRPTLGRMVEALTQVPAAVPSGDGAAPPPPVTVPLDPDRLRSAIYRQFGAYLDVSGIVDDRTGTLDRPGWHREHRSAGP